MALKATHMTTGAVREIGHDETSEHLAEWIRSEFERRRLERPPAPAQPIARPMTIVEWEEVERLREINVYRYQDEIYGTEPLDDCDGCDECEESEDQCDSQD